MAAWRHICLCDRDYYLTLTLIPVWLMEQIRRLPFPKEIQYDGTTEYGVVVS